MMLKTGDVAKQLRISENTVRDYVDRGWPARLLLQADVFSMKKTLKHLRRIITERRQEKMSNEI